MAYVPTELLKCVVFLGYVDQTGEDRLAGSAFWISRPGPRDLADFYRPAYLVTAAHVLDEIESKKSPGDSRVRIRVNLKKGKQEWRDVPLQWWKMHPNSAALTARPFSMSFQPKSP